MNLDPPNNDPSPAEERRRSEGAAPQTGDAAGDLSNTPPSIPKIPSCDLQTGGEDWLDFALYVNHSRFKEVAERLDSARRAAELRTVGDLIQLGGRTYAVSFGSASAGAGKKRVNYRWRLKADNGLTLLLMNRENRHETMPNALATVRSSLLMEVGAEAVWKQLQKALRSLGARIVANKLSRVDACIDLPGIGIEQFTRPYAAGHFVTRARTGSDYNHEEQFVDLSGATYRFGSRPTGISIGTSDVRLRIYDKSFEVRHQAEKQWLMYQRRWGELLLTAASRVEFQLRRARLKSLGVNSFDDWLAKRGAVMEYLTHNWFRLTDGPNDHKHTDRSPTLEVWHTVQQRAQQWAGASAGQALIPLVTAPIRLDQLVLQVIGVMVTVMAREKIKIESSEMFLQAVIERIEEIVFERDMAAEVYRRMVELGVVPE